MRVLRANAAGVQSNAKRSEHRQERYKPGVRAAQATRATAGTVQAEDCAHQPSCRRLSAQDPATRHISVSSRRIFSAKQTGRGGCSVPTPSRATSARRVSSSASVQAPPPVPPLLCSTQTSQRQAHAAVRLLEIKCDRGVCADPSLRDGAGAVGGARSFRRRHRRHAPLMVPRDSRLLKTFLEKTPAFVTPVDPSSPFLVHTF